MLVPFGTHVLDRDGKSVGTVNSLVLHPDTQQGVAVVVQQGVLNRREIVVPLNKIASADKDVRLIDPASARITRVLVREGLLFHHDTAIPASLIESVTSDRITVRLAADDLKKLESGLASKHEGIQAAHPSRP